MGRKKSKRFPFNATLNFSVDNELLRNEDGTRLISRDVSVEGCPNFTVSVMLFWDILKKADRSDTYYGHSYGTTEVRLFSKVACQLGNSSVPARLKFVKTVTLGSITAPPGCEVHQVSSGEKLETISYASADKETWSIVVDPHGRSESGKLECSSIRAHLRRGSGHRFVISVNLSGSLCFINTGDFINKRKARDVDEQLQQRTDVVLLVEGEEIPAHRAVLTGVSDVFRAMFQHDTSEKVTGRVELEDTTATGVRHMLRYMYTAEYPKSTSDDDLVQLAYLADRYALHDLVEDCAELLLARVQKCNVCRVLVVACDLRLLSLIDRALKVLSTAKDVVTTTAWMKYQKENLIVAAEILRLLFVGLTTSSAPSVLQLWQSKEEVKTSATTP